MKLSAISIASVLACVAVLNISSSAAAADCVDEAPGDFPCQMEKQWGKCEADWMKAGDFCRQTCGFCEQDGAEAPPRERRSSRAESSEDESAAEEPSLGDGSVVQVGETSFEVESPKTIEVSRVKSFKGFKRNCKTVIETLENVPGASIMSELLSKLKDTEEELYKMLDDKDTQFTVLVPLDTALEPYLETLEDADDPNVLSNLVSNHMLEVVRHTRTMKSRSELPTLVKSGIITVKSARKGEVVLASGAAAADIVFPNVWACHSIMHFVDNVLPPA